MNYRIYKIRRGETLESIARELGMSPYEVQEFHNRHCELYNLIGGEKLPKGLHELIIPLEIKKQSTPIEKEKEKLENLSFDQQARYRCEQTVLTKLNDLVQNHAETKREFVVSKHIGTDGIPVVKTELTDNIIHVHPQPLTEAMKLISDLDKIKCHAIVGLNSQTGKINKVLNHKEIVSGWEKHKKELNTQYNFVRSSDTRKNMDQFISLAGQQICNEDRLIQDFNTKMFYDLFFDKYLVTDKNLFEPYQRTFYSQLFEGVSLRLNFRQDIVTESEEGVLVRKVGELDKASFSTSELEKKYDSKFKPVVHYKFSEFNFSFRERVLLDTKNRWIESSDVTMIEEVKNNIRIMISYKLRKIE